MRYPRGRKVFVTNEDLIGLGQETMQDHDDVVIFAGGNVPFVLREEYGKELRMMGECHLYGTMTVEFLVNTRDYTPLELLPYRIGNLPEILIVFRVG